MKRWLIPAVVAIVVGFPTAFIAGMLLTPVLWKLEPMLGMELAGHSGPSDWILWMLWGMIAVTIFILWRTVFRRA